MKELKLRNQATMVMGLPQGITAWFAIDDFSSFDLFREALYFWWLLLERSYVKGLSNYLKGPSRIKEALHFC